MAPKRLSEKAANERRVILNALEIAHNALEANEKTFRQAVEELQNGRDVPMFARGDAGVKAARKLADAAFTQAEATKAVLDKWQAEDEGSDEAEAS